MRAYYWVFLFFIIASSNCLAYNTKVLNNPKATISRKDKIAIIVVDAKGKPFNNVMSSIIDKTAKGYLKDLGFKVVNKEAKDVNVVFAFSTSSSTGYGVLPTTKNALVKTGLILTYIGQMVGSFDRGCPKIPGCMERSQRMYEYNIDDLHQKIEKGKLTVECISFLAIKQANDKKQPAQIASGYTCGDPNSDIFNDEAEIRAATINLLSVTEAL